MNSVQFYRDADLPFFELKLCDANRLCYKKHSHEEYSLGIVDNGSSSFWHEGKITEVNPQTLVLIPPGMVHSCNPHRQSQWKYKMLFIEESWMQRFLESRGIPVFAQAVVRHMPAYNFVNTMIDPLFCQVSPLEKEASIMDLIEQAFAGLESAGNLVSAQELPKVKIIKEYLHQNYWKKITLEELEQVSGLNKFAIIRAFKEAFKIPPHTYQTLLRINNAKRLLRQNRPIIEVAYETGFYDQSHFHKVFKSHMGVTPEKYQRPR